MSVSRCLAKLTGCQWVFANLGEIANIWWNLANMAFIQHHIRALWVRLILAGLLAVSFAVSLQSTYSVIHRNNNIAQLEELNERTLLRAEVLVDYAVESMADLQLSGLSSCDSSALRQIRQIIFLRGSIKDIQVLDAQHGLLCSGSNFSENVDAKQFDFSAAFPAEDEHIYFHDITQNNSGIIGIARHVSEDKTFLAVLNLDFLLFGIFPEEIRQAARADLTLGGSVEVATQFPTDAPYISPQILQEFSAISTRYPLEVVFNVDEVVLDSWNGEIKNLVFEVAVIVGLLLGWILLVYLGRPIPFVQQMRVALRNGEFVPFMQPIFDIHSRDIIGCEVLMRWVKPTGEIIPPFRFIGVAEESCLIIEMTRVVMADALGKLAPHLRQNKGFKVAFNIVPADLVSDRFEQEICEIVKQAGVARRQVVLEITERQEFSDQAKAIATIKQLRETGFRVALDDTGVGHNGLSNVQLLGADIIKIDKIFIDRVGVDNSATTIVQMLVRLAHELDMRTVAEGIETEEQLAALVKCDVDEGQGYLISKPLSFDGFEKLVKQEALLLTPASLVRDAD